MSIILEENDYWYPYFRVSPSHWTHPCAETCTKPMGHLWTAWTALPREIQAWKKIVLQTWIYLLRSLHLFPTCPLRSCVTAKRCFPVYLLWLPACRTVSRDFLYCAYCSLWDSQVVSPASPRQDPCCVPCMEKPTKYSIICARKHNTSLIMLFGLHFLCHNSRRK